MSADPAAVYLADAISRFRGLKRLGEGALEQFGADDLHRAPGPGSNPAAVIIRHLAGNMRSRFTDFPDSDGEKPWRRRDEEFEDDGLSPGALRARWEAGWTCLFDTLESLEPSDLTRTVRIRGEAHTVLGALNRQLAHYACHIGQLVYLGRMFAGDSWRTLSIPKGGSEACNRSLFGRREGS